MKLEPIGILAAVAEEINAIKARVIHPEEITIGKATFTKGTLNGVKVVVALLENGWGKVDASATVTTLILSCNVKAIIFSGLGGAIDPALTVGDIVISNIAFQHDFSGEPFFPQCHIPSANTVEAKADQTLIACAEKAAQTFISQFDQIIERRHIEQFKLHPKYVIGTIATGDQFISCPEQVTAIRAFDPTTQAVDMESAAILHVAERFGIPAVVLRTMSDNANHDAHIDFPAFNQHIAGIYSAELVTNLLSVLKGA